MRALTYFLSLAFVIFLAVGCAPDLCPGETRFQKYSSIKTNPRLNQRKAKPSLIYSSKTTSKRKPPK